MLRILACFILIWTLAAGEARANTVNEFYRLCDVILRAGSDELTLPLGPVAVQPIISQFYRIPKIGPGRPWKNTPTADARVQTYVRDVAAQLRSRPEPIWRAVAGHLATLEMRFASDTEVVGVHDIPRRWSSGAEEEVQNELSKLPPELLRIAKVTGRAVYITMGPITQAPSMMHLKGVIPRGWNKSWDFVPGAGGSRQGAVVNADALVRGHGSKNLVLHEELHNVDYACGDLTGVRLSQRPRFLRRWSETNFNRGGSLEKYMDDFPEETFAELGAWFYHSVETRTRLRDEFPEWFDYFSRLTGCG